MDLTLSSPAVSSSHSTTSPPFTGITALVEQEGFNRHKYQVILVSLPLSLTPPSRQPSSIPRFPREDSSSTSRGLRSRPKMIQMSRTPRYILAASKTTRWLFEEAGARSTSDKFHNIYATNIVDKLFEESCPKEESEEAIQASIRTLDEAQYWRTEAGVDCWIFKDVFIQQTMDGLVIVERRLEGGGFVSIKASPSNGKIRINSDFVQVKLRVSKT